MLGRVHGHEYGVPTHGRLTRHWSVIRVGLLELPAVRVLEMTWRELVRPVGPSEVQTLNKLQLQNL